MHYRISPVTKTLGSFNWGVSSVISALLLAVALLALIVGQARAAQSKVEAETMSLSGSSVVVHQSSTASGGQDVAFYTNGSASSGFNGAATAISLRARGQACQGTPKLKIYVDGILKGTVDLTSSTFANYTLTLSSLSTGAHTLRISHENDYYAPSVCDRNAYLDYYVLTFPDSTSPSSPVLVGAGDIAHCSTTTDEATAKLLDGIGGTVFTLGDNAYNSGTAAEFSNCYEPTWGRHKARTKPSVGNHEYLTSGASGYFNYFGAAAGDPKKGYYSYDRGEWHVIVLNSNCSYVSCAVGSAQEQWLRADLAAHQNKCTLAYWHAPLFSSGDHGNSTSVRPFWNALYQANADLVLSGHDHDYERFAPQRPDGTLDTARGIREFVVGTGGTYLRPFGTIKPNSQSRNATAHGVLKLTLHSGSYEWKFVPVVGKTFTDSGITACH
jgi:acid phosphatase type 7